MITVLTGLPRAGKSYYAISDILVPALKAGRKVLCNIEGLKKYKLSSLLDKDVSDLLVICEFSPEFISDVLVNKDYAGYLIIIDESHRYLGSSSKLSEELIHALAVHGHNTLNSDGTTGEIDLILITQSPSSLNSEVLNRAATNIKATNLRQLSMSNKFKVSFYSDPKLYEKSRYDSRIISYSKSIHDCYSSSSGGTESKKTRSIFSSIKVLSIIPAVVVVAGTLLYGYNKLNKFTKKTEPNPDSVIQSFLGSKPTENPNSIEKTYKEEKNYEQSENKSLTSKNSKTYSDSDEYLADGICVKQFNGFCLGRLK